MIFGFFASKNKKLIKHWKKEHQQMAVLGHKVLAQYAKNNKKKAKKELKNLSDLAIGHLLSEDIHLYKILKDDVSLDPKTKKLANDFVQSFKCSKTQFIFFLSEYTKADIELDETFYQTFHELFDLFTRRIEYEERHLYKHLQSK